MITLNRYLPIAVGLLIAGGCTTDSDDSQPVDVQASELEAPTAPAPNPAPSDRATANEMERAAKADWNKTPTSRVETVDWPAANGYPHISAQLLPESEREKLEQSAVPVLVPRDADVLDSAIVTLGDDWYAASLKDDGASLHIRGTRRSFDFQGDVWTPQEKALGDDYTLTRTHQLVSVSFGAFGIAYTLDVECSRPMDDVRCTEDTYVLDLANDLAVAGGLR
jgi:hypothetical protein